MKTIGLVSLVCVLSVAVGEGEAGKKKKAKVPKGYVETLLGPGEWVVANDQGEEMTLRSTDQRTVGGAKVARLQWTFKDMENSMASPPAMIAVTKKGIHLLGEYEASVGDKELAKALKKRKPEYKLPLKVGKTRQKGADHQNFVEVRDGNVCIGFNVMEMCGGMGCDAEMCLGAMGLASVSGAYSPDEMQWNWVAGGLTVAEEPVDPGKQAIAEITALKDRACACKDAKCGDAVMQDLDAWTQANAATTATADQLKTLEKLGTALGTCVANLR